MSGDNTIDQAGVYGTQGTAAAANKPTSRYRQSGWIDGAGNIWIFGGSDYNGNYNNDLWKFNTTTRQWTWMSGDDTWPNYGVYGTQGVAGLGNKPGQRDGQTAWVDAAGNFWIFGGYGYDDGTFGIGRLNDLWKYTPATGLWTWVSGETYADPSGVYGTPGTAAAGNEPGGRRSSSGWIDAAGNFWIFGGYGWDAVGRNGDLNDLWKYNPTTGLWTWVSGNNSRNRTGTYGTKGTAAPGNKPGNRDSQSAWADASGNFWIFGGYDYNFNYYSDLWKYNPTLGQWTWVSGSSSQNVAGSYGTKGVAAAANAPGARMGASGAIDGSGRFWIFGGTDKNGNYFNDLWMYDPVAGQWTWQSGNSSSGQPGVYGTKGTASATNVPGSRYYQSGIVDASNNLWVFGGKGYDGTPLPSPAVDYLNDLWKSSSLIILAIREISFEGVRNGNENVLSWKTSGETNTAGFQVERSLNGVDFSPIGDVPAAGAGDNHYSFIDRRLTDGSLHYRLKMTDLDGNFSYSKIILLTGQKENKSYIYPNPAKNSVTLQISDKNLLNTPVKIFDISGKILGEARITGYQQSIDLSRAPKGVCLLQLSNGEIIKILKE